MNRLAFWFSGFLFGFCGSVWAGETPEFTYVGSHKCIACHKKEERGNQAAVWAEGPHGNAFQTLYTEKAARYAQEKNLLNPPYLEPFCVRCHTVGFNVGGYRITDESFWNPPAGDRKAKRAVKRMNNLKNVGCEACHGAGSGYMSKKKMEAISAGKSDGPAHGLKVITEESCLVCHNQSSPAWKGEFQYEEALRKIAHPMKKSREK